MAPRRGPIQETQLMDLQTCHLLLELLTTYKYGEAMYILPWMIISCSFGKDSEGTVFGLT